MANIANLRCLARQILDDTEVLTGYLESQNKDAPSFDTDGIDEYSIHQGHPAAKARTNLVTAAKKLHDLALGPREFLQVLAWDSFNNVSIEFIYVFQVAKAVPLHGDISFTNLTAELSSMNETPVSMINVRRLVRHAMVNNIFCEPRKGYVAHTRPSRLLLEDELMINWHGFWSHHIWPVMTNGVKTLKRWPLSEDPRKTPLSATFGEGINLWEFLAKDPETQRCYSLAINANGRSEGFSVVHTVKGYPWHQLGEGLVVDMGGSQGQVAMAIAEAYPMLKFIVQDLPSNRLPSIIGTVPKNVANRVTLTTHDFLTPQTVQADAYMFRWVFHAFPDSIAVDILRNVIPVLKKGTRIIVNDGVIPDTGAFNPLEEKSLRSMDLCMWLVMNARERDVDDWKSLFEMADKRFKVNGAWKPEGSMMWFIEAIWTG